MPTNDLSLMRLLLNDLPDGVLLAEYNGKVLYANPAAESLFGAQGSLVGNDLGYPLVEGVTEIELVNKMGEMITAEMRAALITWNATRYIVASLRNITDRKNAHEKVIALGKSLLDGYEEINRRTGKDLHDRIGQPLIGLKLAISRFTHGSDGDAGLKEVNELIDQMINNVRDLSHNLRPVVDKGFDLHDILENHFHRIEKRYGISINFTSRFSTAVLTPLTETVVLRVIQEGIDNVIRYADVDEADVSVESQDHTLHVTLEDRGRGFEPLSNGHPGLGLRTIRERVELAGGTTRIESAPGKGTTITVTLPLE